MFGKKKQKEELIWEREAEFQLKYARFDEAMRYYFSIEHDPNVSEEDKDKAFTEFIEAEKLVDPLYKARCEWMKETNSMPKKKDRGCVSMNTIVATAVSLGCTFGPWALEKCGVIIKRPTEWIPKHLFWRSK